MSSQLDLCEVSVRYGDFVAANAVSLSLQAGEIGCLLGPSGCGKTTLLRAIAGFEQLASGSITLHGKLISERGFTPPPEQRRVGMVFQDFALFPHLNVQRNVGFGLHTMAREQRPGRVEEMLQLVGLDAHAHAYPHELSGGQQQRVALARALAPNPELLLLDEPFSSLDSELREKLAAEVRTLLKASNVTTLLVTHDQHEAFAMADQITLLSSGKVAQAGSPFDLYHHPASEFVASFIGLGSILRLPEVKEPGVLAELARDLPELNTAERKVLLRPENIRFDNSSELRLPISGRSFRGGEFLYELSLPDGQRLLCLAPSHLTAQVGDLLPVRIDRRQLTVFDH